MQIFQKSIINKYLKSLDEDKVSLAYDKFQEFYGDRERLHNIMQLKEENYQEGFLREIFVQTLGYTINPDKNYNLTTEYKNQKDSRKADGAILKWKQGEPNPCAVIELKSTKTRDFESIKEQAFGYKNNQPDCKYVITSNFQYLRFYIDNATEYEEFNLFEMASIRACNPLFRIFYLLLNKDSIIENLPEKLKQETKFHEEQVTKKLYQDYKNFKDRIFETLIDGNPQYDKLTLFKKSQKLLDRFLFILFAEDSGLIPPNAISKIIDQWKTFIDNDEYFPLYNRFQKLFKHLDKGHTYKHWGEIPAYNGGLFREDEILDNPDLKIPDGLLQNHTLKLSAYDFGSEIDVNILGHIFEHSLGEIEEITGELAATATKNGQVHLTQPKPANKRKKDGIFYTPKYITKYIVENTVGKLCEERKAELKINNLLIDDNYYVKTHSSASQRKTNQKGKQLYETLQQYKNWLLTLKILDPSCGSGAFLNQTLDFLINEHKQTDDLIAELTGDQIRMFDTDKAILENNIYGVDINVESVEIAKLSLWLRTAQRGRTLSDLSGNIKCGNSLINDPEIAGEKAFDWEKEFPNVFIRKEEKIWHITTATHNSRYSQRMFDYKVKIGEAVWLEAEDEIIITKTIAQIVKEDRLNILAYNICGDHMHLLLVCNDDEMPGIVGKLKAMTARRRNIAKGYTIATTQTTATDTTRGHAPLSLPDAYPDADKNPRMDTETDRDTKEKRKRGKTQTKLWTQKFGKSEVDNPEYLRNAIKYICNNRKKHKLPENTGLQEIIDSFVCSTKHAFHLEYKGGFDVVLGNPPYVRLQGLKANYEKESLFYEQHYRTATSKYDIYVLFIEKSLELIKNKGKISFILPHKFLVAEFGKGVRGLLAEKRLVESILHFGSEMVFSDATAYTCILNLSQGNSNIKLKHIKPEKITQPFNYEIISYDNLSSENWNLNEKSVSDILHKINRQPLKLEQIFENIYQGIVSVGDDIFMLKGEFKTDYFLGFSKALSKEVKLEKDIVKPVLKGQDIKRYNTLKTDLFVIYPHYYDKNNKTKPFNEEYFEKHYPLAYNYMLNFKNKLIEKKIRYKTNPKYWYSLHRSRDINIFESEKIITPQLQNYPNFTFDTTGIYADAGGYILNNSKFNFDLKYILCILNSTLLWFFIKNTSSEYRGGYYYFKSKYLEPFPLPQLKEISQQNIFISKADQMLSLNKKLQTEKNYFLQTLQEEFGVSDSKSNTIKANDHKNFKTTKSINDFYELEYDEFKKELLKQKIKISLGNENNEWREYFNTTKLKINDLQSQINQTDKEINKMVYELYGLNEEEIGIVEKSIK